MKKIILYLCFLAASTPTFADVIFPDEEQVAEQSLNIPVACFLVFVTVLVLILVVRRKLK